MDGGEVEIHGKGGECNCFKHGETIDISYTSQIRLNQKLLEGKLPNISFSDFKTLGAREWLNDEVINYFVKKWCSRSSTLGLSTFFACKVLFDDEDNSCIQAKHGVLTLDDEETALRWCRRADVSCFPSILKIAHSDYKRRVCVSIWGGTRCLSQSMKTVHTGILLTLIFAANASTFTTAGQKPVFLTNESLFYYAKIQASCL